MNYWIKLLMVFLLSTVKLGLGGVPLAFAYRLGPFESILAISLGGITGSLCFILLGEKLWPFFDRFRKKKEPVYRPKLRKFVNIKNKFGLPGIAFLSPFFISIPLGCLLATRFFGHQIPRVIGWMIGSVIFWTILLTGVKFWM